ncbi:glycosyltransferase family 9 protein [Candidatus Woesearchaeota archaeon]|nr:glycosyltransferase family 9 protein [Candidatus Woesearchaeota archaeon]
MYMVNWKFKILLYPIDFIGNIVFFPYHLLKKKMREQEIKKILVIRIDEIGDVLLTTPVFLALRKRFPEAEIHALVKESTKILLKNNPNVNKILICRKPWLKQRLDVSYYNGLIKELKKEDYDVCLELHPDARNIFLGFKVAHYVAGHGFRGLGFLLDRRTQSNPKQEHIVQLNLDVARLLGADSPGKLEIFYSKKKEQKAATLLKGIREKIICINPGAGRATKLWSNERWAKVADDLVEKYKAFVIFTGSREEQGLIKNIQSAMKHAAKSRNLAGKTSLPELAALLRRCAIVLGTDSGTLHIARAVGSRIIGLYGAVDPKLWGYHDKDARSISKVNRFAEEHGKTAMWLITVEDVLKEVSLLG